ncbi:MAG: hypothetical protein LBL00_06560 [Endomicrobium sp.]|jgi:hypothetical protein|nr:hypothetical protein [Endomicrobium sp.]
MLKKVFVSAFFAFFCGIFCNAGAQEAVIKLDSREEIERFQEMLNDGAIREDAPDETKAALSDGVKGTPSEAEFKVYKPQPKESSEEENAKPKAVSHSSTGEENFEVFIPEAKEENTESAEKPEKNIKWLDSSEDIEEFEEILKKAKFGN